MSVADSQDPQRVAWAQWQKQVKGALSDREWEVVKLAARGLANLEIAALTSKAEDTIKTRFRMAVIKLDTLATQAGVLSLNRTGLAVMCVRADQAVRVPCPHPWAVSMDQMLTAGDRAIVTMAVEAKTDEELTQKLTAAGMSEQMPVLYRKVRPFQADAGVGELDREGLVELFVRAGTEVNPAMYGQWRAAVRRVVSVKECDVLTWLSTGLSNREIAAKLGLSPLTIKSHLARVAARLEPYGPLVGIERPSDRTGLAVMTVLARLDRSDCR